MQASHARAATRVARLIIKHCVDKKFLSIPPSQQGQQERCCCVINFISSKFVFALDINELENSIVSFEDNLLTAEFTTTVEEFFVAASGSRRGLKFS